jgi:hypothetical protein
VIVYGANNARLLHALQIVERQAPADAKAIRQGAGIDPRLAAHIAHRICVAWNRHVPPSGDPGWIT